MIFRQLDQKETEEFRQFAKDNPPESMKWWDVYHPVCREVWVQQGYASEVGDYQYGDSPRGIIDADTGEILCLDCGEERENQATLYHINIAPYSQSCWECGEMFFHGWIPTELFPKVRETGNDTA